MDNKDLEKINEFKDIILHAKSIQQPRSNFQLTNFVLGQHDTEPMKFYQLCLEITELFHNIEVTELELEKLKIRKNILIKSDNEIDKIDAKIIQLNIDKTESIINSSKNELLFLINLYQNFPKKYSREDIENDQFNYWNARLKRQAILEQVAVSTSQSEHFNSMRQIGLISVSEGKVSWNNKEIKENKVFEIED